MRGGSVKKRITIFILSVGTVCILAAMIVIDFFVSQIYISREIELNTDAAMAVALNIDSRIYDAKQRVQKLAKYNIVREEIAKSIESYSGKSEDQIINDIKEKDAKWIAASGANDSFIKEYLSNEASARFSVDIDAYPNYYEEIFLTNKYGEMIATTAYLSNLYQAGEYWWDTAYNNGRGQFFVDDRGFDVSSDMYVVGVAAPVYDDNGTVIGVVKANINADTFFTSEIKGFIEYYSSKKIYIVRTGGYMVYGSHEGKMAQIESGEIAFDPNLETQAFRFKDENGEKYIASSALIKSVAQEDDIVFGGASSDSDENLFGPEEGEDWYVLYVTPMDEITYFSNSLYSALVVMLIILLILGVSFAVIMISRIANPIMELADAAEIIGEGNLDYKINVEAKNEVKKLADAMTHMTVNLKSTLASRDELKAEMVKREKLQKEKDELSKHLSQQQKMEAVGTLASGVAHEINNPLNGIMNYAQIIVDMNSDNDETKDLADEIINESKRVSDIVKNLINFSTQSSGHFSVVEPEYLISQCVELLSSQAMEKQVKINIDIQEGIKSFDCRPQQLKQVLLNLIRNSIETLCNKYESYDNNKTITISAKEIMRKEEPWIQFIIKDKGMGISKDIQDKIFEPFFTTKSRAQGIGLGLYISHSIIHEHGGILTFVSEEGMGTSFIIMLPVNNPLKKTMLE